MLSAPEFLYPYFHDILYECYAIGGHPNFVLFNFVQSVITTWQVNEFVRCVLLNMQSSSSVR
jgi:hypothetical protein